MPTSKELEARLSEIAAESEEIRKKLDENARNRFVRCKFCSTRTRVGRLAYIQTHLERKHDRGTYWARGEGQFDCPKCGGRNRLYDRPEVMELRRYFASVTNEFYRDGQLRRVDSK